MSIYISMVVNEEESGGGSVSGMWAKLKQEEDVDFGNKKNEAMKKSSSSVRRVCHICLKAFSSGKALGGHMRSHVQLSKTQLHQTPSDCVICGKNFPSMKALFGHMRCHPERDWRGIHPPPEKTDHDRAGALDLTESLRRWPVTAKRGRKASSELDDDEDGLHEAVNFLMMLAEPEGRRKDFHGNKMKVQMKKKKRKKVKLCDLNLHDQKCDERSNNIPTCGKLLEFDLNEVPESEPQLLVGNYIM